MATSSTANGVYRTPGRELETEPPPPPPWPLMLAPVASAAGLLLVIALPVLLFDVVRAVLLRAPGETRFVPVVDLTFDLLALALLACPIWLGLMVAARIAPYWRSVRPWGKVSYVAGLLVFELVVLVTAEASLLASRARTGLFEPTLQRTALGPDGRRAHVYGGGLVSCRYDVYVAAPHAVTMNRQLTVAVHECTARAPRVRWGTDRSVQLVDDEGKVIEGRTATPLLR